MSFQITQLCLKLSHCRTKRTNYGSSTWSRSVAIINNNFFTLLQTAWFSKRGVCGNWKNIEKTADGGRRANLRVLFD